MGGSSSKTRNTKYDVSHTVDSDTVTAHVNINSKDSTRRGSRKKKNSIKIKQKNLDKSKSVKGHVSHAGIDDGKGNQNNPVYRKKSACPSCDAKDILLGKNRSRSGSEKSLRFSDFNKVLRKTRIYDWELTSPEIALYGVDEPRRDDICYICEVYTGSHVRACRVCCRAYHDSCLSKIGHPLTEICRRLIARSRWSCHQCVSLNHLLTQEEVRQVLNQLADLDISSDNMTENNYLKFCKNSLQRQNKMWTSEKEQNSIKRFRSVVTKNSGLISYTQFLNIESIRILNNRCKDSLVHLLTPAEIAEARKSFQGLDTHKTGVITRSALQTSLLANKSQAWPYYHDDSLMYIDEDQDSAVTWADFLRETAISILGQRPNLVQGQNNADIVDKEDGTMTFSSCDSLDADGRYQTCESDLEPGVADKDHVLSKVHCSLDVSAEERILPLDSSTTMLDEINSVMDRCGCSHELPVTSRESDISVNLNSNSACERDCSSIRPQIPAGLTFDQVPCNHSPKSRTNKPADGHWAGRDSERARSSPYNDSRHTPIPWEDVEKRQEPAAENDSNTKPTYRRSEVITRQAMVNSDSKRAVSQAGCRLGRNTLAPAYGNLVGRINSDEWRC